MKINKEHKVQRTLPSFSFVNMMKPNKYKEEGFSVLDGDRQINMQVQRENSPNNEMLAEWAASLRHGDGRRRYVDFSLKHKLV